MEKRHQQADHYFAIGHGTPALMSEFSDKDVKQAIDKQLEAGYFAGQYCFDPYTGVIDLVVFKPTHE